MRRPRPSANAVKPRPPRQRKSTILCIDDDAVGSALRQAVLQRAGYRVLIAASGTQGLEMAKRHSVNLILVDFDMPDLNGFSVAGLLRGIKPSARIVMVSGHESKAPQGFHVLDGFIPKATPVERFLRHVSRQLQ